MINSTIIIGADNFITNLPEGYVIESDRNFPDSWVHNNIAIGMSYTDIKTKEFHNIRELRKNRVRSNKVEDAVIKIDVPVDGEYILSVRSYGTEESGFNISVNGRMDSNLFGNADMSWKKAEQYHLRKGNVEIRLHMVKPKPFFDMMILTTEADFNYDVIPKNNFPKEVELLKEYKVPRGTVKFGILEKNGKTGFAVFENNYSAHVYDYDGKELWVYKAPELSFGMKNRAGFEAPGVIWDIDNDGISELIHWRYMEGEEWLVASDALTGKIKYKTLFPSVPPDDFNNYRIAVARLELGYPSNIIVLADSGGTISINAYDQNLNLLWSHVEKRLKDNLGHYIYPRDINGDGIDEIIVGALALDSKGEVIWNRLRESNHEHVDSIRFADINGDGKDEIIAAYSNLGVNVINPQNGDILWSGEAVHNQQVEVGHFLKDSEGPQIAAGARLYSPGEYYIYGQIFWYDAKGKFLKVWPKTSLDGNPDFAKGDWQGNGQEELFWYLFKIDEYGNGTHYFADEVVHMFDFTGEGAENPITRSSGILRVYGNRFAKRDKKKSKRDIDYVYKKIVNYTHY